MKSHKYRVSMEHPVFCEIHDYFPVNRLQRGLITMQRRNDYRQRYCKLFASSKLVHTFVQDLPMPRAKFQVHAEIAQFLSNNDTQLIRRKKLLRRTNCAYPHDHFIDLISVKWKIALELQIL